jgi:hypothetical protein
VGTKILTLKPDFFKTDKGLGALLHLEQCSVVLQTGNNTSVFTPSDNLQALGTTERRFSIAQYRKDREEQVGSVRKYDTIPCAQWLAANPSRAGQECPYYRDEAITAKFNLVMNLNDLRADRGLSGSFSGTNLIVKMTFEDAGKELTGSVSKKIVGNADVTIPVGGELSNTSMRLTFALSASNGQLDVQFSSLDFNTNLALDAAGQQVPAQLMDRTAIQSQFIQGVKSQGTSALRQSRIDAGLKSALNKFIQIFGVRTVIAVRPGSHGGADVEYN